MQTPASPPAARLAVSLFGWKLTGPPAAAVLVVLLALLLGAIAYFESPELCASAALWLAFVVYWSAAARGASPPQSGESAASRRVHTRLLLAAFLFLFVPVPGLDHVWLPASPWLVAAGLTVQAGSGLLAAWARRHLGRHWSGAIAVKQDPELVRSGPYRRLRHPIYTAMLGMCVGTAVVARGVHAVIGVAVLGIAYARKIPLEERALQEAFGPAFDEYRRQSWALIPGVL